MTKRIEKSLFVVELPPPRHGMSSVSDYVVRACEQAGPVQVHNLSSGRPRMDSLHRACKALKVATAAIRLLFAVPGYSVLYLAANSGIGVYYDMLFTAIARLRKTRVVIQHHTFAYISRRDWRMKWINRFIGPAGTHVFGCEHMVRQFEELYGACGRALTFINPIDPMDDFTGATANRATAADGLTIGHLSNLSLPKGLDLVLATVSRLIDQGCRVKLLLAGPVREEAAQALIDDHLQKYPSQITHLGPVYGAQKNTFFQGIDVFLFPSRTEMQPLVLAEAMAHGVPAITTNCGCIKSQVQDAGVIYELSEDYVARATALIQQWIAAPEELDRYRTVARQRILELQEEGRRDLDALIRTLVPNATLESDRGR